MFKYVLLFALVGFAVAGETSSDESNAEIRTLTSDVRANGFNWAEETSNGISAQASGDENGNIHGDYKYESKDGPVQITYVADENGYQPSGSVLPTPPPTPEAILKALAYIAAHPTKDA